jgi:next-to-BRCA1 protein 1
MTYRRASSLTLSQLRHLLCIAPDQAVVFERYSDSAGGYVVLDDSNPAVFKTLIRAAKAKLKLKLRASAQDEQSKADAPAPEPHLAPSSSVAAPKSATTFDQHSIGPGIFEFREAISSMKKTDVEAPLPRPFMAVCPARLDVSDSTTHSVTQGPKHDLPLRVAQPVHMPKGPWTIFCNACDKIMYNTHYHCSTCEGGDYDLCETCVEQGTSCLGEGHWLVKRSIQDGKLVSSTTERVAPKSKTTTAPAPAPSPKPDTVKELPGAFNDDIKTLAESSRTCNSCVVTLPNRDFVTCLQCDDYDICLNCHMLNSHGHHPAHHFKSTVDGAALTLAQEALLPAGRNFRHTAICDGCDKMIHGVRHKCFDCPDFDYCSECHKNARHTHPRHRFAAIYEHFKGRPASSVSHHGIYCDGPLCKGNSQQSYIQGVRYKCVVCHDTDFCQSCEALPTAFHNKTHPLVKFKTPVNHLTISTESETQHGVRKLGDRNSARNMNTPVMPSRRQSVNATAPVKTVADILPYPPTEPKVLDEKKVEEKTPISEPVAAALKPKAPVHLLEAVFIADRVPDGTVIAPNARFVQSWTLRNPGPFSWPAGCSVRFVGGDNMLNIDNTRVAAASDIAEASESNVVGREVFPGEQFPFTVTMKAPAREGKCISYWRLKSADGTPFGHKLWCDIEVRQAPSTATDAASVPRSPITVQSSSQAHSYYALYKERMNALKTHLDQTNAIPAVASNIVSQEAQKPVEQMAEVTETPAEAEVEVPESEHEEDELKGSQMVFPTLDKESPTSSTYQSFSGSGVSKKAHEETEKASQTSEVADSVASDDEGFEDISDDLEVLSANEDEDETEDDGFLTDDDYDILDASDQETVASMK